MSHPRNNLSVLILINHIFYIIISKTTSYLFMSFEVTKWRLWSSPRSRCERRWPGQGRYQHHLLFFPHQTLDEQQICLIKFVNWTTSCWKRLIFKQIFWFQWVLNLNQINRSVFQTSSDMVSFYHPHKNGWTKKVAFGSNMFKPVNRSSYIYSTCWFVFKTYFFFFAEVFAVALLIFGWILAGEADLRRN